MPTLASQVRDERTFHIGGTAQVAEQSFFESSNDGTARVTGPTVTASDGLLIVMSRNTQVSVQVDGKDRETYKPPYGARLRVKDGESVKRGQRIAEWDPYTTPIVTEVGGKVRFEDLVDGLSVRDEADEATGISNRVIIDWRASPRGADLRPAMAVLDVDGGYKRLANGGEARNLLPVGAILSVGDGDETRPGDVLARIPTENAKTRDITGGLPRVAELFEARRPKDCAVIAEMDGRVEFGRDYKNKRRIKITPEDGGDAVEFLIPKGKHIAVHDGDVIRKGEYIIDGNPDPHDILRIQGIEALAEFLVNEIQEVYRLQGVPINDKHIETIVRQMLQKVEIMEPGDTGLLKGDHLDKLEVEEENAKAEARGGRPALTQPVLLGITKASLQTRSFFSAASFQETTRVLTEASVQGKVDTLEGLKENVIVGRLIPAGTGSYLRGLQRIAAKRDEVLAASRVEAIEEALPAEIAEAAAAEAAPAE
jgi:DNA-directed RNA polymerase subunit beta'